MPLMSGGQEIVVGFSVEDNGSPAIQKINNELEETQRAGMKAGEGAATANRGLKETAESAEIAQKKMAILGTVVSATTALLFDSYKSYSELAESVRDLSLVSGASTESTSRFIQVLDDYQITAEDATSVSKKLKDDGLTPTIETLAMLSDQYRGIKDPAEKLDFIQDKLGKSGAKWVNVLNQGSAALLANADAINKNLILSDLEIKMYEVGRLAIDEKRDAVEAFKVSLGQNIGNVLAYAKATERANQIFNENSTIVNGQKRYTIGYSEALQMAIAEQLKAAESTLEYNYNLEREAKVLLEVSQANKELLSSAIAITDETRKYEDAQSDIQEQIADLQAEKDGYYSWEVGKIQATQDKIDDLNAKYEENADAYIESVNKKMAMAAIEAIAMEDGVAGYSEAEYQKAQSILLTTDVATAAAFEQSQAQQVLIDGLIDAGVKGEDFGKILQQVGEDGVISMEEVTAALDAIPSSKDIAINVAVNGMPSNLNLSNTPAPVGTRRKNAGGGSYMIPMAWGNEGMPIGSSDTASGGELISITPKGQNQNADLISAIQNSKVDERRLAKYIVTALAQAGM